MRLVRGRRSRLVGIGVGGGEEELGILLPSSVTVACVDFADMLS